MTGGPSDVRRLGLATVVLITYGAKYTTLNFGALAEGVGRVETRQLFEFVRSNTRETDVLVFRKPRVLALYTGRRATVYHLAASDDELRDYLDGIDAQYLVTGPGDPDYWLEFIDRQGERLDLVFSNPDFEVHALDDDAGGAGSGKLHPTRP